MEYYVITALVGQELKTALVEFDLIDVGEECPEDFFLPNATEVVVHGKVDITGEAKTMLPQSIVEG